MAGRMLPILLLASAVAALKNFGGMHAPTPTEKVIEMLQDLGNETQAEQDTEKKNYETYSGWCNKTNEERTDSINNGEDQAKSLVANLEKQTGNLNELLADLAELTQKKEQLEAAKAASAKQCEKDKNVYDATRADLDQALSGLSNAIKVLHQAKGAEPTEQSEEQTELLLLQHTSAIQQSLDLGEAMGFLPEAVHRRITAFLQGSASAEPDKPWLEKEGAHKNKEEYGFQSGGIVATLQDIEKQFTAQRDTLIKNWEATKAACEQDAENKRNAIEETENTMASKTEEKSTTEGIIAEKKSTLHATRKQLAEDREFLEEVMEDCRVADRDYVQRSKNRAGEIKAIAEAEKAFKDTIQDLETDVYDYKGDANWGNKNASKDDGTGSDTNASEEVGTEDVSLARKSGTSWPQNAPSLFQQTATHRHVADEMDSSEAATDDEADVQTSPRDQAISLLSKAGGKLKSLRLSMLAVSLQEEPQARNDPLAFVKKLVEKMVNDLQKEELAAISQKGFCDMNMMKNTKERDRRHREALSLNAKMKALDTHRTELVETIALQKVSIADMQKDLTAATEIRVNESTVNLKTIADSSMGAKAVQAAIVKLSDYYKKANRMADRYEDEVKAGVVLVQQQPAPTIDPQTGKMKSSFGGSYGGKQNEALGVITLMEVIRDSFLRTEKETQHEEDEASEEFTKLKQKSRVDISSKKKAKTLNEQDLETTNNDLRSKKEELIGKTKLAEAALVALEDLRAECVDNKMTYEERMAARQQELDQLTAALCILDVNKVEPQCQTEA